MTEASIDKKQLKWTSLDLGREELEEGRRRIRDGLVQTGFAGAAVGFMFAFGPLLAGVNGDIKSAGRIISAQGLEPPDIPILPSKATIDEMTGLLPLIEDPEARRGALRYVYRAAEDYESAGPTAAAIMLIPAIPIAIGGVSLVVSGLRQRRTGEEYGHTGEELPRVLVSGNPADPGLGRLVEYTD